MRIVLSLWISLVAILPVFASATLKRNLIHLDQISDAEFLSTKGIGTWDGQLNAEFQEDIVSLVKKQLGEFIWS